MHLGTCLASNRGPLLDLDRYSVGMISPPRKAWSPHSRIPGELETKIALFGFPHNGNRAASCLSPTLQCLAGLAPPILKIHIAERDAANRPEPAGLDQEDANLRVLRQPPCHDRPRRT